MNDNIVAMMIFREKKVLLHPNKNRIYSSLSSIGGFYLPMAWKMIFRYVCAMIWMAILCCFSYSELLVFIVSKNTETFETFFVMAHSDTSMILTNVGLIGMLYVDNFIIRLFTKSPGKNFVPGLCLTVGVIMAIFITILSRRIVDNEFVPAAWFKVSYLFGIFIVSLIVYKAESLEISHHAEDCPITPSKNKKR